MKNEVFATRLHAAIKTRWAAQYFVLGPANAIDALCVLVLRVPSVP